MTAIHSTILSTIPAAVETLAAAVEAVVGVIAPAIETVLDAVAAVVERVRAAFVAAVLGDLGAAVQALVDAVALAIQAAVDLVPSTIEAMFDAVAAVAVIGGEGVAGGQRGQNQAGSDQGFHGLSFGDGRRGSHAGRRDRERPRCPAVDSHPLYSSAVMMPTDPRNRTTNVDGFVALYIFMLAAIAGHVIISRVPVILHTPLMSGSNFIHGIVLIGAMVVLGHADTTLEKAVGFVAVLLGAGNAAGGYVVTERMLDMFKSSKKPDGKGDKA